MRLVAFTIALAAALGGTQTFAVPIGTKVENFTLKDYHGQPHSLKEAGDGKIVVLAFLGTECPLAKLYAPKLAELAEKYAAKGVVFLGHRARTICERDLAAETVIGKRRFGITTIRATNHATKGIITLAGYDVLRII